MNTSKAVVITLTLASLLTSPAGLAKGTSVIIDAIEAETNTMTRAVDQYQEIQHDFAEGARLEEELINTMLASPNDKNITLKGKQMIQKKLSGINAAIAQVDDLFASSERMEVLIGELINETENQNQHLPRKEKREQYHAAANQASGTYQTINYLMQNLPNLNAWERNELANGMEVAKSQINRFHSTNDDIDLTSALRGLKRVFGSLSTKLLVDRDNLVGLSKEYITLDYTFVASDTEAKISQLVNVVQSLSGRMGIHSQQDNAIKLRNMLLQRRAGNALAIPGSDNSRYDDIAAKIDAGELQ